MKYGIKLTTFVFVLLSVFSVQFTFVQADAPDAQGLSCLGKCRQNYNTCTSKYPLSPPYFCVQEQQFCNAKCGRN